MRVSVVGLGYVGCVTIGCLAKNGHFVTGVDTDPIKVGLINQGKPTIVEKEIDELISLGSKLGRISAVSDLVQAVMNTDVTLVSVGTPPSADGRPDMQYIFQAAKKIGEGIKNKKDFHTVIIRSTVPPGTTDKVAGIIEEISVKLKNKGFGVAANPEFLREGTAVADYFNSSFILAGTESDRAFEAVRELYKETGIPIIRKDVKVCEVMKYVCNSYHALKVVFANEVGDICKKLDTDSHQVMEVFCRDTKLNISPYYFKPGFAYGGSCLPKDLKGLCLLARDNNLDVPVLESIYKSNEMHKDLALKMIVETGRKNIGVLGLSFKAGTDDLRESPMVDIVERLLGKGVNIRIYDKNVYQSNVTGTNSKAIAGRIPHLIGFISEDLMEVIRNSEVIVIANLDEAMKNLFKGESENSWKDSGEKEKEESCFKDKIIIDFVRAAEDIRGAGEYHGICW